MKPKILIKGRGLEGDDARRTKQIVADAMRRANYVAIQTEYLGADAYGLRFHPPEILAVEIEATDAKNGIKNALRNFSNGATRVLFVALSERLKMRIAARIQRELPSELAAHTTVITTKEIYEHIRSTE